jgi:putative ATPase
MHIRNSVVKEMEQFSYGKGYKYPHDFENAQVSQQYLPDELKDRVYYKPTDNGFEKTVKEIRKIKGKV